MWGLAISLKKSFTGTPKLTKGASSMDLQQLLTSWCSFSWLTAKQELLLSIETVKSSEKRQTLYWRRRTALFRDGLLRLLVRRLVINLLGQPVWLVLMRNLQARFSAYELAFLLTQSQRLFRLMPAHLNSKLSLKRYTFRFGAIAIYLATTYRDTTLLINWIQSRLRFMSLFRHRQFFRVVGISLLTSLGSSSPRAQLAGFSMQITGKLSVTGNAMSRTYLIRKGKGSLSALNYRLVQGFTLVRTRTGCLGLWLSLFF